MKKFRTKRKAGALLITDAMLLAFVLGGCGTASAAGSESAQAAENGQASSEASASEASETKFLESTADGAHVITADGEIAEYSGIKVVKSGDAEGDEADFYGENAAIFATNGATLTLSDMEVVTDGTHANAVFSYGEGTTVNISDSVIQTSGNCSGGLMTTGGGTMNAENLTIHTSGNSSAAIRSDRGGGTVNVTGGEYTTDGTGSPVIYSTADITVSDAALTSTASQGVVVEGRNSVTLNDVSLTADNNTKNSDKSDYYQAVMIYQSMSGDAAEGLAEFTMSGGTLVNRNGDVFFVNNTDTEIHLSEADITNEGDGVFLRAAAAGWGNEGENGGNVSLYASRQTIEGDMLVDAVSTLNLYLSEDASFTGAINPDGAEGDVYVELADNAVWTLSADSHIASLTCGTDAIDLNGHTLYVGDAVYEEGTASSGEAVASKLGKGGPDGGFPGGRDGNPPDGGFDGPDGRGGKSPDGASGGRGGNPPDGTSDSRGGSLPDGNFGGRGGNPPDNTSGGPGNNPSDGTSGDRSGNPSDSTSGDRSGNPSDGTSGDRS